MLEMLLGLGSALLALAWSGEGGVGANTSQIEIPARTVEIAPTRPEPKIAELWLQIRCVRRATPEEERRTGDAWASCDELTIDGEPVDYGFTLELQPVARNRFHLGPHTVRFSRAGGGHLCLALRAIFEGIDPARDYEVYSHPEDRYSLLSYCTLDEQPKWAPGRFPFDRNRVETFEELERRLSEPIPVALRPEPTSS